VVEIAGQTITKSIGPLVLEVTEPNLLQNRCFSVELSPFCKITPEPEQLFWKDINLQVKRYMKLLAFS
jgi:hypothetical protein